MSERLGWTLFMAAGVVVLVLLGLHMVTMHLDDLISVNNPAGGSAVDWANVVGRAKAVSTAVGYVLLLGAALFHGLFGLRTILFELSPAAGVKQVINVALTLAGCALFAYGTWAAWASYQMALRA